MKKTTITKLTSRHKRKGCAGLNVYNCVSTFGDKNRSRSIVVTDAAANTTHQSVQRLFF